MTGQDADQAGRAVDRGCLAAPAQAKAAGTRGITAEITSVPRFCGTSGLID